MPKTQPATLADITTAQRAGQHAAEANQHLSTCPYKPADSSDEHTRFLQVVWIRAYRETQALLRREDPDHTTATQPDNTPQNT